MVILSCFIVLLFVLQTQSSERVNLNGPSVISWTNSAGSKENLAIYGLERKETMELSHVGDIPEDYIVLDGQCDIAESPHLVPVFTAGRQLQNSLRITYLHASNDQIKESGQFVHQTKLKNNLQQESLFRVVGLSKNQSTQKVYFEFQKRLYSIEAILYSAEPRCSSFSPPSKRLVCDIGCNVYTPSTVVLQNRLDFISHLNYYTTTFSNYLKDNQYQSIGNQQTLTLQMNQQATNVIVQPLQLRIDSVKLTIDFLQKQVQLHLKNTLDTFAASKLQVWENEFLRYSKILFLSPHNTTIVVSPFQNRPSLRIVLMNDLVHAEAWSDFGTPHSQPRTTSEQPQQNQQGEQTSELPIQITKVERNDTLGIIIGAACGGIGMIVFLVAGKCLWVRIKKRIKANLQKELESTKKTESDIASNEKHANDSGRPIQTEEMQLEPKMEDILKSDKSQGQSTRGATQQTLKECVLPPIMKGLRSRAQQIGEKNWE